MKMYMLFITAGAQKPFVMAPHVIPSEELDDFERIFGKDKSEVESTKPRCKESNTVKGPPLKVMP